VATFPKEFDAVVGRRMKELGRVLTREESEALEAGLFHDWVDAGRYDELIRRMHAVYEREGGLEECIVLGKALQEARDVERIDTLFSGLISRRVKAFWSNWALAESGHPGHMHGCARQSASALEAYLEYYSRLANLGLDDRKEQVRHEMLAFQARERSDRVPAARRAPTGATSRHKPGGGEPQPG
jgi:hypothetical protein